jgi:capsular polysaccharide biosynthesis protein
MTTIISFKDSNNYTNFLDKDINNRQLGFAKFDNIKLIGRNLFYPNILLQYNDTDNDDNSIINPYDEKIMSLNKDSFYDDNIYDIKNVSNAKNETTIINIKNIIVVPVFFFIYNFDNYYHFLYDTIPYLYIYFHLKQLNPELKLLVNYPNFNKSDFYKFNLDILEKFIDIKRDLIIHNDSNVYAKCFVSSSLTHGGLSNVPPRNEIYELYERMKKSSMLLNPYYNNYEYIYISRRTWIHNDTSNIGTNYTTRRKMMNEDELVIKLTSLGVNEIFAEHLSIDEKIQLFSRAKLIIGSIGGGMSNLLFSNSKTKSIVIVTPDFLNINYRFKYSMEHTDITYFDKVNTYNNKNTIPLFCRVKIIRNGVYNNKIGEIIEYNESDNKYIVNISNNDVAGFNNSVIFESNAFLKEDFILLDNGLNSPYEVDIEQLITLVNEKINNCLQYNLYYKIINKSKNTNYFLKINEIIELIKCESNDEFYKEIDGTIIKINNDIILKTHFICHRINNIDELKSIPDIFGTEVDIRDYKTINTTNSLILSHDPYTNGNNFQEYFKYYINNHCKNKNKGKTIILNIKSERTELECIKIMNDNNFTNYFFLDSNLPMIYLLNKKYNNTNIACRFSEFEPIENYECIKNMISWIWVDCFTIFPLNTTSYNKFKSDNKKICIVSPELQNQIEKIDEYRDYIIQNGLIPDAICCKLNNIIRWI